MQWHIFMESSDIILRGYTILSQPVMPFKISVIQLAAAVFAGCCLLVAPQRALDEACLLASSAPDAVGQPLSEEAVEAAAQRCSSLLQGPKAVLKAARAPLEAEADRTKAIDASSVVPSGSGTKQVGKQEALPKLEDASTRLTDTLTKVAAQALLQIQTRRSSDGVGSMMLILGITVGVLAILLCIMPVAAKNLRQRFQSPAAAAALLEQQRRQQAQQAGAGASQRSQRQVPAPCTPGPIYSGGKADSASLSKLPDYTAAYLCPELVVPEEQECTLLVPRLPEGGSSGQVTVDDLRGVAVFRAYYGQGKRLILSSAAGDSVFAFCRDGESGTLTIHHPSDAQFGSLRSDGGGYTVATRRGVCMHLRGDVRLGNLNATDEQGQLLAIAEPVAKSNARRSVRIGPQVDAGLVALVLLGIDVLEQQAAAVPGSRG
mmetsp:Transcript_64447/g.185217  ORF Transcript_64447/g.185217 Transcript_64447/m.185217 type:complete len:432 (+) Transcript_64447:13-1308(+)